MTRAGSAATDPAFAQVAFKSKRATIQKTTTAMVTKTALTTTVTQKHAEQTDASAPTALVSVRLGKPRKPTVEMALTTTATARPTAMTVTATARHVLGAADVAAVPASHSRRAATAVPAASAADPGLPANPIIPTPASTFARVTPTISAGRGDTARTRPVGRVRDKLSAIANATAKLAPPAPVNVRVAESVT